jgi:hypothetical protein
METLVEPENKKIPQINVLLNDNQIFVVSPYFPYILLLYFPNMYQLETLHEQINARYMKKDIFRNCP